MAANVGACVVLETSWGDIAIDLFTDDCPKTCENFLKLCKLRYYNGCPFHRVERDFVAQCGDGGDGGCSVWGMIAGAPPASRLRCFGDELAPQKRKERPLRHSRRGTVSMANAGVPDSNTSQFIIQLADRHLDFLDGRHTIFGEVAEGWHVLDKLNEAQVDDRHRPLKRVSVHHTHVLEDPFADPPGLRRLVPARSPSPDVGSEDGGYISSASESADVDPAALRELLAAREARSRELVLEMVGDIADADMEPPKNVLFVCNLNPVTEDEDLEMVFSRFGRIDSCEVMRARDGKSLQYAFIEFREIKACEQAYLKMENVRVDDRRIHVDFSQSVPRIWNQWMTSAGGQSGLRVGGFEWKEGHKKGQPSFSWKAGAEHKAAAAATVKSGVSGTVKQWFEEKGFGFIRQSSGGDVFVHRSAIEEGQTLRIGDTVTFDVATDPASGRVRALRIVCTGKADDAATVADTARAPSSDSSSVDRGGRKRGKKEKKSRKVKKERKER
eukprot:TRINITY_DN35652_c0_g1_i1.p1 TRINITY_DN35652_c0_g1~~TRINITY_DN35652_c0_g1_i1.p1  ORF type:complete len:499 (+),score=124.79 TRINITY_DN35652_c0_g1_i1:70-1566(+)